MKRMIYLLFLLIPLLSSAAQDEVIELFKEGNENYKKGRYEEAIRFYESILSKDIGNGYVYYNLGNAYFKADKLGKAVLNYERAKIYLPSDSDVDFNLKFMDLRLIDKIPEPPYNPFTKIILYFYNLFEINTLFGLVYFLFLILIGSLAVKWFYKNLSFQIINRKIFYYSGIIFIIFLFILIIKVSQVRSSEHAIIIAPEIKVKSGPSEDYTDIFTLHEGFKVKIRKKTGEWLMITLPNGFSGFIKKENLEII